MRPIKLKFQAFGPYIEASEIDFTKFNDNDLFLITGNTGAGKTAIFDAMSYALYGQASGDGRAVDMLRNSSAENHNETFVSFTFEYYDQDYEIRRTPRYMRPKERGEGETEAVATAELKLPNGEVISGVRQVDEKIYEILQINQKQFSQIVMIAQNDFQKFLKSNTSDRQEILRTIFRTNIYRDFEEHLKVLSNIEKEKYDQEKSRYTHHLSSFKDIEENLEDLRHQEVLEIIKKKNEEDEIQIKVYLNRIEEIKEDLTTLTKEKTLAQSNNKILKQYEQLQEDNATHKKKEEVIKRKEEILLLMNTYKQEFEHEDQKISSDQSKINEQRKDLQTSEEHYKIKLHEFNEIKRDKENIESLDEEKMKLIKDRSKLERLLPLYIESETLKTEQKQSEQKLCKLKDEIDASLYDMFLKNKEMKNNHELKLKNYTYKKNKQKERERHFDALEEQFLYNQAGLLAQDLSNNEPCPVCGSLDHPRLAELSTKNIEDEYFAMKEEVLKERNSINQMRDYLEEEMETLNKLYSLYKEFSLRMYQKELTEDDFEGTINQSFPNIKERIDNYVILNEKLQTITLNLKRIHRDLEYESKEILEQELMINKKHLDNLERRIAKINEKYTTLKEELVKFQTLIKEQERQVENLDDMYRKDKGNFEKKIITTFKSLSTYDDIKRTIMDRETLDLEVKTYHEKRFELETLLLDYKKQSKGKNFIDTDSLEKAILSQSEAEIRLTKEMNHLNNIRSHNIEVLKKLIKVYFDIQAQEKVTLDYISLSETASGSLSKKAKIHFETYAQMAYFDRVIYYANQRLKQMSNQQYELIRREDSSNLRSQGGLDLDILDHHYGTQRDVATLSGGESFNTSLALALGLSDAIQHSSGGIKIDALFIDEGFGSLSDDYLDSAIATLQEVAGGNRLIGVISHVKELKEEIENQIIVSKDQEGSHIKIISV